MIVIRDGRLWVYDNAPESVYPSFDFELLAGYVCPACKTPILAYCVGQLPMKVISYYHDPESNRAFEVINHHQGGFVLRQTNHGRNYNSNCRLVQFGHGRNVYQILQGLLKDEGEVNPAQLKALCAAIERGEYTDRGIYTVADVCGQDAPIVLFDLHLFGMFGDIESRIASKLVEYLESYKKVEEPIRLKRVAVEVSKLGKRAVRLSEEQTALA
jgi:hypothetical protein